MKGILFGAAILAALTSAPLAISRREAAPRATPPEIVSMVSAPSRAVSFPDLDVKSAWGMYVGLRLSGAPAPRGAEARFIDAFFDGRLPAAAGFVRSALANVDGPTAACIADKARSFDRALIQLSPAPEPLLRAFVERSEDPDAHIEATRANAEEIARLVADPAIGERAFELLRAAQAIPATALQSLSGRVGRDAWARAGLGALGTRSVPALLEALDSDDGVRRAAGAWVLAVIGDPAHVERILQAALPELARDSISGNAAFAIRALTALGERARPAVRGLLKSADDQALAGALQVLMKTGGASNDELDAARSRVERLAARAGEAGDEAAIGLELRAALAVTTGAMTVPGPPEKLNPSQTETSGRSW